MPGKNVLTLSELNWTVTVFPDASVEGGFTKYLTMGGMPYLSNLMYDETASRQYLQQHRHNIFFYRYFKVSEK